jgi:hypothetical protein
MKVKLLPETEAWAKSMHETGAIVQYALLLDEPKQQKGRCYWPVQLRAGGTLWRTYYVSPDGRSVLRPAAPAPRAATAPLGSTAAAR